LSFLGVLPGLARREGEVALACDLSSSAAQEEHAQQAVGFLPKREESLACAVAFRVCACGLGRIGPQPLPDLKKSLLTQKKGQ
jgi:hypothetical protein